jgi:ribosomal protein S18 acetylase RimI-like enzyme
MGTLRATWTFLLRPATQSDAEFIYQLRRSGLRPYVEQLWGWDEHDQRARFRGTFDPTRYQVIVAEGEVVGAISLEQRPDEMYVHDIEVVSERRGQGLGTAVLSEVLRQAHNRGLPVSLQVLNVNPAHRLYERLGFRVAGTTSTHVLMRADAPQNCGEQAAGS